MNEHLQELKCGGRPMTKLELLQKENKELKERINKALLDIKEILKDNTPSYASCIKKCLMK